MPESIPQHFARDPVDFVSDGWRQRPLLALNRECEGGRILVRTLRGRQILSQHLDRVREIILGRVAVTQVFDSILALSNCLLGSQDRTIEGLQRLLGPLLKHIASSLKLKHQSMQALK
jgi:hypothetical protein